ncbi:MAG: biotin transporter BioY [Bacteroidia bacterium]
MQANRYRPLMLIILTAGSMVIGAKLNFSLGGSTITLQTFFLCLTALFFLPGEVFLGQLLYLISGFFVPVFAGEYMGMAVFNGSSAGYLYAFPVAAYVLARYGKGGDWFSTLSWTIVAHFVILLSGYLWLTWYSGMDSGRAITAGFLTLLPGAFVKGGAATLCYAFGEKYIKKKE